MRFLIPVLLASAAEATVYFALRESRDGSKQQTAWTNGTPDPCSGFTVIRPDNGNPCGIDFYVDGRNGPFTLNGCGNGLELDREHHFNSVCRWGEYGDFSCPGGAKFSDIWTCS